MENQVDHQGSTFLFPSEFATAAASIHSWPLTPCQFPASDVDHACSFFSPLPPFPADLYSHRNSIGNVNSTMPSDPLGLSALYKMGYPTSAPSPYGSLHAELISEMTAQEIMDAKAQAASKSHSEAERRRRERINTHLARLRSLLPNTTKTDKASLLAEVIQHVKELKRQTSKMAEESPLPTEADELNVVSTSLNDDGRFVVKASLCCEDRSDLIPDIIKALKSLRLRALKAEITTLGGRVKNILVITGEEDVDNGCNQQRQQQLSISSIQEALRAVMERSSAADESHSAGGGIKRQRTSNMSGLLQQRSL